MTTELFLEEVNKRRTFAIISHPDAGKTTITEKVLLFGQLIQKAGTVKGKKSGQYATSDWMEMEKERGISVTTSVMQFPYADCLVNLLDTPGHEDFSEDTYRTLTAVDSCLMVIDGAKGVEDRTIKLMEVTRLRDTPIITFMNKMDRDIRDPVDLLDEVEKVCSHVLVLRKGEILYTGTVAGMSSSNGVVELQSDDINLLMKTLEKYPNIDSIEIEEGKVIVQSSITIDARELNKFLVQNEIYVTHLVKRNHSLEEQFLQLTATK